MLPVLVVVVLGLTTTGLLIALMLGLVRHLKVLAGALKKFQDEVRPMAEGISADGNRARDRLATISERLERTPGARIRR